MSAAPVTPDLARILVAPVLARFLDYAARATPSDAASERNPSTDAQLELARLLAAQLEELSLRDVEVDRLGVVYGTLPATAPTPVRVGLVAHLDTAPDLFEAPVRPQVVERYAGGPIALPGRPGEALRPEEHPELTRHLGHILVTSDGRTALGADDKAGLAEIVTALEYLVANPDLPHPETRVAFSPDEEIGRSIRNFRLSRFGADVAYVVDGGAAGEIEDETFAGAELTVTIMGRAAHAGFARGRMVNSVRLAGELVHRLAELPAPERASGREGYVHPWSVQGRPERSVLRVRVRDFDAARVEELVGDVSASVTALQTEEPEAMLAIERVNGLPNMKPALERRPDVVARAERAIVRAGLRPVRVALRGVTDGAALTARGVPAPNLFTGAHEFHTTHEWICAEDMGTAAATLVHLLGDWAR